jgi:hypothetical protein
MDTRGKQTTTTKMHQGIPTTAECFSSEIPLRSAPTSNEQYGNFLRK